MSANRLTGTLCCMLGAFLLQMASFVSAQEMTERHIPVGAYPYLKSETLAAGTIVAVDDEAGKLTLATNGGERSYRLTASTQIWLDRSRLGRTTVDGRISDLTAGLKAEVRSLGPDRRDVARWVKVQIAPP
jgi:hypothetical protein